MRVSSFDDIIKNSLYQKQVYDSLSQAERDQVDAFNDSLDGLDILQIIAKGEHPMKTFMQRYEDEKNASD